MKKKSRVIKKRGAKTALTKVRGKAKQSRTARSAGTKVSTRKVESGKAASEKSVSGKSGSVRSGAKAARAPKKMPAASVGSGLYLFGISKGARANDAAKALAGVVGIDGLHPVEEIASEGLSCWVTRVRTEEFADEMNRNAENLDWLAETGLRHQRAVAAIASIPGITLLPTRFGVLFSGEPALMENVASRKAALREAFERVAGCEEWGVKVFAQARSKVAQVEAASGKDYLERKAEALAASGPGAPDEEVERFAKELQGITRASAVSNRISGAQPGLQWQATFLLPVTSRKKWDAVMKKYAQGWGDVKRIECTGPWPPYSFVAGAEDGR
jgi:hypothetical protein